MKIDIINTNYIFDHKLFKWLRIPVILYGVFLIAKTSNGLQDLSEYESVIEIISSIILYSCLVFVFLNAIIFSRCGELKITENTIHIDNKDQESTIKLESLNKVSIGKDQGKFYSIYINDIVIQVIMEKDEFSALKDFLKKNNIQVERKYLSDKITKWLKINGA